MKAFFKKHTLLFTLAVISIALFSNLMTGFLQSFFPEHQTMYYLVEAILKSGIAAGLIFLMTKWGYTKKSNKKNIALGFILCAFLLLFMAPNLLPLIYVNPILFDIQWDNLFAILFATMGIGFMEEAGIRGTLLPLLCEKWKAKKHSYLKAALVTSVLFGCIHFNWSVRYLITHGTLPLSEFLSNFYQVSYCFCFGLFAAGITMYTRSILSIAIWHGMVDFVAFMIYALIPLASVNYYNKQGMLTFAYVLYKLGINQNLELITQLIMAMIDILLAVVGIILILKAEKKNIKSN